MGDAITCIDGVRCNHVNGKMLDNLAGSIVRNDASRCAIVLEEPRGKEFPDELRTKNN